MSIQHLTPESQAAAIDEMAQRLVAQDVRYCVSYLVSTLIADAFNEQAVMSEEDAMTLSARKPDADDYRDAAQYGAGFSIVVTEQETDAGGKWHWSATGEDGEPNEGRAATELRAWADAFEYLGGDEPAGCDCLEHWLVTDDLARRLREQGEAVADDVAGLTIWGRCTSGQAIYADAVIQRIARNILEA